MESATRWQKIVEGILSINTGFDGMAFLLNLLLSARKGEPRSHQKLPFNEVKSSDHFRDRVFNLKTSVHLHEVVPVGVKIEDEFDCSCVVVADCPRGLDCGVADRLADLVIDVGRSFFDNFLMPSLNGTVSFEQMDVVSLLIAKNLDLNMAGASYVFLHQDAIVAEGF